MLVRSLSRTRQARPCSGSRRRRIQPIGGCRTPSYNQFGLFGPTPSMPADSTRDDDDSTPHRRPKGSSAVRSLPMRILLWTGGAALAAAVSVIAISGVALAVAYPNLPDISELQDYRPKLPLRVYSADCQML